MDYCRGSFRNGFATSIKEDDDAQQSINEMYLNHQVMLNKDLEKELNEVKEALKLEKAKMKSH